MPSKAEMVARVAEEAGISRPQAQKAVDALLNMIGSSLAGGQNFSLSGFGTFRVSETAERQGRNPATGQPITIPAGRRIGFSPGSRLSTMVRGGMGAGGNGGGTGGGMGTGMAGGGTVGGGMAAEGMVGGGTAEGMAGGGAAGGAAGGGTAAGGATGGGTTTGGRGRGRSRGGTS